MFRETYQGAICVENHTKNTNTTCDQNDKFLCSFAKLRKTTIIFVMSVRLFVRLSVWSISAPTRRIFIKFDVWLLFESLSRKSVSLKSCMNNEY